MDILRIIADNPALFEALSTKLMMLFDFNDVMNDLATCDDKKLGEIVRARLTGLMLVEKGMREIAQYKTINSEAGKINPAR